MDRWASSRAGTSVGPASLQAPRFLHALARACARAGLGPERVTAASLGLGLLAGAALALGHLGVGGALATGAALGGALDGLVARAGAGATRRGGLLDAVVDRYGEFFFFGGLAVHYRADGPQLALTLVAMLGSFMVGYGSAKAEALRVSVPRGSTRQGERAAALCGGALLSPIAAAFTRGWLAEAPMLAALALVGSSPSNVAAVRRLGVLVARAVR